MRSPMQRLRIAAATNDINVRDEAGYFFLAARDHPHGLGIAIEVRGELFVRLPDEINDEEVQTIDVDIVLEWVTSL